LQDTLGISQGISQLMSRPMLNHYATIHLCVLWPAYRFSTVLIIIIQAWPKKQRNRPHRDHRSQNVHFTHCTY